MTKNNARVNLSIFFLHVNSRISILLVIFVKTFWLILTQISISITKKSSSFLSLIEYIQRIEKQLFVYDSKLLNTSFFCVINFLFLQKINKCHRLKNKFIPHLIFDILQLNCTFKDLLARDVVGRKFFTLKFNTPVHFCA